MIDPITHMEVLVVPKEQVSWLKEAERRHLRDDGRNWIKNMTHILQEIGNINPLVFVDYGCSGGHFLSIVPVAHKYGYEIDPYAKEKAKQRNLAVISRWEEIPTADCVTIIDVIEHMSPPEVVTLIYQLRDKLNDDGCVIFQSDNPRCIASHLDFYNDYTHVRMYDIWTFVNLLNLAGFCCMKIFKALPALNNDEIEKLTSLNLPTFSDPYLKWVIVAKKVL